jgi:hypothetical protein
VCTPLFLSEAVESAKHPNSLPRSKALRHGHCRVRTSSGPDLGLWASVASQLSEVPQQWCGKVLEDLQEVGDGGRLSGCSAMSEKEEGGAHIREGRGCLRHFDHDDEVLWWWRCEQLGCLPHSGGLRGRCVTIRMKVLPVFGRCQQRRPGAELRVSTGVN